MRDTLKIKVSINNLVPPHCTLNLQWWENITQLITKEALSLQNKLYINNLKSAQTSLYIVPPAKIQQINKKTRNKNSVTDVLSFPTYDNLQAIHKAQKINLGEIVICLSKCIEQAGNLNHSIEREAGFLYCHGLLHLLGYDHQSPATEKEMFNIQENILHSIGLKR